MRKHFLCILLVLLASKQVHSQARGTKIGYIDMEYILQNVPNYSEATVQLEQKVQKWKQDIESKKIEINKIKDALKAEKALLTKNLIEEREAEIKFLEQEMLDYQQKRFGINGDLMLQKAQITKPIQDQVFTAVQDIAEAKKFDFIFDKSSDLTMLFAAQRFDISDQVLRLLTRADKREQLTKKQLADQEAKENKEDTVADNEFLSERQKALEEKKAARDKIIEERKAAQEQKRKEYEDRRAKMLADREAQKNGTVSANTNTATSTSNKQEDATKLSNNAAQQKLEEAKAAKLEQRTKILEDRKKALEERQNKIRIQRDSIKNAK
ncbi:OmpH family outer membrane protein [Flavobacterium crassostreae]|uniref:Outer membrane chaperone Skp n=1 Tax=Flavobacterium crassostreae TaxID=1763534 RepID=A0A1B9DXH2_9FLAO|nr:OmpH family outer membrane protein [Flavobacterium crassostreae]OCB74386.1 hypothetical protein LPBF_10330 [Flavobacterium crassostreae]